MKYILVVTLFLQNALCYGQKPLNIKMRPRKQDSVLIATVHDVYPLNDSVLFMAKDTGQDGYMTQSKYNHYFIGDTLICYPGVYPGVAGKIHSFFVDTSGIAGFIKSVTDTETNLPLTDTCLQCDSGYYCMPTLSSSDLVIIGGSCLPDSVCKRLYKEFAKDICGETGMGYFSLDPKGYMSYSYDNGHTWDDSLGCIEKPQYQKTVKYKEGKKWKVKWVDITKGEFDKLCKCNL